MNLTLNLITGEIDTNATRIGEQLYLLSYNKLEIIQSNALDFYTLAQTLNEFTLITLSLAETTIMTDRHGQIPIYFNGNIISTEWSENAQIIQPGITILSNNHQSAYIQSRTDPPQHKTTQNKQDIVYHMKRYLFDLEQTGKPTLMLSGGVDSTLIFAILVEMQIEFNVVTASFGMCEDSPAVLRLLAETNEILTKKCLKKLYSHCFISVTRDCFLEHQQLIKDLIKPSSPTIMNLNLAAVWYFSSLAFDCKTIISGLGPDEYFGAYAKFRRQMDVNQKRQEIMKQITGINDRNIKRDSILAHRLGFRIACPYLVEDVGALMLDLYNTDVDKSTIRQILEQCGYSLQVYSRKKRAAQFGSGAAKILGGGGYDVL